MFCLTAHLLIVFLKAYKHFGHFSGKQCLHLSTNFRWNKLFSVSSMRLLISYCLFFWLYASSYKLFSTNCILLVQNYKFTSKQSPAPYYWFDMLLLRYKYLKVKTTIECLQITHFSASAYVQSILYDSCYNIL